MNLENIQLIVQSGNPNWEQLLLQEIASDKAAIGKVMVMLDAERRTNEALISDLNALLSQAHVCFLSPSLNKDGFLQVKIGEFYKQGRIGHCFNVPELKVQP